LGWVGERRDFMNKTAKRKGLFDSQRENLGHSP
jgi:hypothetical protein